MESAYDGPQIMGMDLHRKRSVLVRMTPDGRKLATARNRQHRGEPDGGGREGRPGAEGGAGGNERVVPGC